MKFVTKIALLIFWVHCVASNNLRSKTLLKEPTEFYSNSPNSQYESPHIVHQETPIYVHSPADVVHSDHFIHTDDHMILPATGTPFHNSMHHMDIHHHMVPPSCMCANQVRCHPCGEIVTHHIDCPCAPKLNCPICPPLSLIHEIAAKKARDDQKLAYDLQNVSRQITTLLNKISKFAGDVVKSEIEAKTAARNMEEASIKAEIARREMIQSSEKAKFIARTTIMSSPCSGVNCPVLFHSEHIDTKLRSILNSGPTWYGSEYNKIFPEEVGSIKDYDNEDSFSNNRRYQEYERKHSQNRDDEDEDRSDNYGRIRRAEEMEELNKIEKEVEEEQNISDQRRANRKPRITKRMVSNDVEVENEYENKLKEDVSSKEPNLKEERGDKPSGSSIEKPEINRNSSNGSNTKEEKPVAKATRKAKH